MSVRLRLTLWYTALLGAIVAAIALFVYTAHTAAHYAEVDRLLLMSADHLAGELEQEASRSHGLAQAAQRPVGRIESTGLYARVFDAQGVLVAGTDLGERAAWPRAPEAPWGFADVYRPHGEHLRVYRRPIQVDAQPVGQLELAAPLHLLEDSFSRLRLLLVVSGGVGLLAAFGGGWLLAQWGLAPIEYMTRTARSIAQARRFSQRLEPPATRDEVAALAIAFNALLASLEEAYAAQRRFIDDASHELRAPLTTIRGNLDVLERARDLPDQERAAMLADLRAEVERMTRLVDDLLALARADAGQQIAREPVELDAAVLEAVARAGRGVAGRPAARLEVTAVEPAIIVGDREWLQQLVAILLDNALRYTPPTGRIAIALAPAGSQVVLTVADDGPGIAPEHLPHLFERFYRADPARSAGGTGLGLAIAKWIVDQHAGTISIESAPGRGTCVRVCFPRTAAGAAEGERSQPALRLLSAAAQLVREK